MYDQMVKRFLIKILLGFTVYLAPVHELFAVMIVFVPVPPEVDVAAWGASGP